MGDLISEISQSYPKLESKLAGLLVPVFALRHSNDFGIGDTKAVREAIDFCRDHHFGVLQTLPIHETISDHSPYNPITSRGLSPALLSLAAEDVPGLSKEITDRYAPESWLAALRTGPVRHGLVHSLKLQILLAAHRAFIAGGSDDKLIAEFEGFQTRNSDWLPAYTLYRLLVREYEGNANWQDWRPEHHSLTKAEEWLATHEDRAHLERLRSGFAYVQWVAWRQWSAVRDYATAQNVMLMGEISFGVSRCGVDVWSHPELFDLEWNMGTRPIVYFDTNKDSERFGQNWGLPPYRWENHRSENFAWLRGRIAGEHQFFHICRIDHLRGYFRAYMFPWSGGATHAEYAKLTEEEILIRTAGRRPRFVPGSGEDEVTAAMNEAQGRQLITVIREAAQDMVLFAEIMGRLPDYIQRVIDDLEIPSLVFPQLERNDDRSLVPASSYRALSLGSYANHDHAPLAALYTHLRGEAEAQPEGIAATDLSNLLSLAEWKQEAPTELDSALLYGLQRNLFSTPCLLTVLMSSDLLGIPQRFNLPGSYGSETWNQRLEHSWAEYVKHPVFGPRISAAAELIKGSKRSLGSQLKSE